MFSKILRYLNPIAQLGKVDYSVLFPLLINTVLYVLFEIYVYQVIGDESSAGSSVIFVSVAVIIYFAFRDGISGGLISTGLAIFYYLYIVWSRNYSGDQLISALETIGVIGIIYAFLAVVIGWLKQTIDYLIVGEKDARYQAEQDKLKLQTILQQLPVGVLMVDKVTGKLDGNKQMEKILGTAIPERMSKEGGDRAHFAYMNQRPLLPREWPITRALTKGEIVTAEEVEFVRRDKKRMYLRINAAPIKNRERGIIAAVSTLYDITQEKDLERRKDDFVNMASHELKTPITSIKLYVELLERWALKNTDQKFAKTVSNIKLQTERLQELVNDLLDVTRIQTGKLHLNREAFDIVEVISETIEVLQHTTNEQPLIFTPKKPLSVLGDRFRIYQVLTNLITNAVKYSPAKTKISIAVKLENDQVVVSVKDQGIGIDKDQQKKIFERLYQVSDVTEKSFPGLGMGLYISKEIIRRHKGKIWVEGSKGKGSTFYFSLPKAA